MIVSFNSNTKGYVGMEAHEYRVTRWPSGQQWDDPFVRFHTLEYEQPVHEHIEIETDSTDRVVLSVLRTIDRHTDWEHYAVSYYQINGEHVARPTDLAGFDPWQYYRG